MSGTSSGGSGNVVGPASSTNGSVAVFSGTTGKLLAEGGGVPITTVPGATGDVLYNNAGALDSIASVATGKVLGSGGVGVVSAWTASPTLAAGTITTSQPVTITQTWNDGAVTFNALKVNITATASAAASTLADLQVASVSKFSVGKDGAVTSAAGFYTGNTYSVNFKSAAGNNGTQLLSLANKILLLCDIAGGSASQDFVSYDASPPSAPVVGSGLGAGRLYVDKPTTKYRLMVLFPSGASQQLAIEP